MGTHRKDENCVKTRTRVRVKPEHSGRQRDLLGLAEDVEADANDDDHNYIEADCCGLNCEGCEQGADPNERRRPRNESVDSTAYEWRHCDTEHTDEAKQTYGNPENRLISKDRVALCSHTVTYVE